MPDDLRQRIDDALQESMDRCARCKACDAQVDAVMAVIADLVQLPEGTVTEWAVRFGDASSQHVQPYYDEDMARGAAAQVRALSPDTSADVVSRQVGPWTEAPETAQDDSDA
jgi:hypothetical protein